MADDDPLQAVNDEDRLKREAARAAETDRAIRSLVVFAATLFALTIPLFALLLGAAVRIFRWASGL